jgi:hypothetical protein
MTTIQKLREIQNEEINNGFVNGNLWNDLEDLIFGLENPTSKIESVIGDMFESNVN